jgi:hypothetical protein
MVYFMERVALHDKIQINYYFTKSYEEFLLKAVRGRSCCEEKLHIDDYEEFSSYNNIKNDRIMDKYIPLIRARLRERLLPHYLSDN